MAAPGTASRGRGAARQKPRDIRYVLRGLWRYLHGHLPQFALSLALILVANVLSLFGPRLAGQAIDAMGPGSRAVGATSVGQVPFPRVLHYCLLMLLVHALQAGLVYVNARLMVWLSQSLVQRMRQDLYDRLIRLPIPWFDRKQTGEIISHMTYDIDTVNASLSNDIIQIGGSLITVTGSLVMMLAISWKLSLVFAFTVPISILFTRYRARLVHPLFRERSARLGELNAYVEEIISGQRAIRVYHREAAFVERFDSYNEAAVDSYYRAEFHGTMTGPFVSFINNISLSLVSLAGAFLYLGGSITLGPLSSFVLYSRKFSGPINEVANIFADLQSAAAAAERVLHLLDEEPEPADPPDALSYSEPLGHVRFEDVSFSYLPGVPVLERVSFEARPGEITAIVGETGAGKTTIINLLMRFYEPSSGVIWLDGVPATALERDSVRRAFGMVLQETWLFDGTVRENLAYGRPGATDAEIREAARACHIDRFIEQLPEGYDTRLTGGGRQISQGQRQLLTIARAMLTQAPMLILDEATSHVDTRTERRIQDAMRRLMEGRSSFVIAHRLSTVQHADRILVISDGRLVEQGTHNELLATGGHYADLYAAQFD